ncbi:MAG: hypothetical protein SNJ82_12580, partial [Gemmataceae bacterium]
MLETLFPEAAPVARVVPATVPGNLVANSDNSGESERFEATLVPPVTRNDPSNQPGERGGRATVSESDTLPPSPTPCVPKDKTIVPLTSPSDTATQTHSTSTHSKTVAYAGSLEGADRSVLPG